MKITAQQFLNFMDVDPDYTESKILKLLDGSVSLSPEDITKWDDISLSDRGWLLGRLVGRNDPTRSVARRIVRDFLGGREIPYAYQAWLDTGDESLREAARDVVIEADRGLEWYVNFSGHTPVLITVAWHTVCYASVMDELSDAAWETSWHAAQYSSEKVGGDVARHVAWDTAWLKYIGWMVEFLA